jgi:hypothetical protein
MLCGSRHAGGATRRFWRASSTSGRSSMSPHNLGRGDPKAQPSSRPCSRSPRLRLPIQSVVPVVSIRCAASTTSIFCGRLDLLSEGSVRGYARFRGRRGRGLLEALWSRHALRAVMTRSQFRDAELSPVESYRGRASLAVAE